MCVPGIGFDHFSFHLFFPSQMTKNFVCIYSQVCLISIRHVIFEKDVMLTDKEVLQQVDEVIQALHSGNGRHKNGRVQQLLDLLTDGAISSTNMAQLEIPLLCQLGERLLKSLKACGPAQQPHLVRILHNFLNAARRSCVLQKVQENNLSEDWFRLLLAIVDASNFTTGALLMQRVQEYGEKSIFQTLSGRRAMNHSWRELQSRVFAIAKSLLDITAELAQPSGPCRVAILSDNTLDMVCIDLACLICGIVNVPIPVNATPQTIRFIINHSRVRVIFVSRDRRLAELLKIWRQTKEVHLTVAMDTTQIPADDQIISFGEFLLRGITLPDSTVIEAMAGVKLDDLATVMYTSGTTEAPKGIMFSHRNIISKRFARAIALPQIGDQDRFLCYLPLFHTFGRYFEMVGSLFWGATYSFIENTKIETIVENMQLTRPTVFISIPKKWIQLREKIGEKIDVEHAPLAGVRAVVQEMTGGCLKWGLSAAGYLDPDIFRFFQECGVEIMSGFGMTEATGGITMTPPFDYRTNSVGKALPGIDIKLAQDGEMLIRGPYVMMGYLDDETTGMEDGWLHTGDIFRQDGEGFFEIIDRKKEIYKSVQGETISPQKIENLFNDFEAVRRVFLVGDRREYNTLLLFPNYDYEQVNLRQLSHEKLREFFGSIIVSINQFLAPYERIVNFTIIDRDFEADRGELTVKSTYKRKAIEQNFAPVIEEMYARDYVSLTVDGFDFRIPSWFLRAQGLTSNDLKVQGSAIVLTPTKTKLHIRRLKRSGCCRMQIGSFVYETEENYLDLGMIVRDPTLWLGNLQLGHFVGHKIFRVATGNVSHSSTIQLQLASKPAPLQRRVAEDFGKIMKAKYKSVQGVHVAAFVLQTWQEKAAFKAIDYLQAVISDKNEKTLRLAKGVLMRSCASSNTAIKRRAFQVLLLNEKRNLLRPILERFLLAKHAILDRDTIARLSRHDFSKDQLNTLLDYLAACLQSVQNGQEKASKFPIKAMLRFITAYGVQHPVAHKSIRAELVRWRIFAPDGAIKTQAERCLQTLRKGFRNWLGDNLQIAIDPETREEFRWKDVLFFEETIPSSDREIMAEAIQKGPLLREAIFIFSGGRLIPLHEIPQQGIYISFLGALHGKAVYRVSVQTHSYGAFDVAINLNKSLSDDEIISEINWLICAGATDDRTPLVEEFGGYWPEYGLWTEEFIPGETVARYLRRLDRQAAKDGEERMQQLWPSFVWNGLSAYIDFWNRTGRTLEIADPTPANVIVPSHDFLVGFRIVSISSRKPFATLFEMILAFRRHFILSAESTYTHLKGRCSWHVIFSAFLEILGEKEGVQLFEQAIESDQQNDEPGETDELVKNLSEFITSVREKGYKPERLHFAIARFKRWYVLNPAATRQARMQTLRDLYTTYILAQIEKKYPGARIQFFRDTVFSHSDPTLIDGLNQILRRVRRKEVATYELPEHLAELRGRNHFSHEEQFFLTRLSYPHLGVKHEAEFVSLTSEGAEKTSLVVFIEDNDGNQLAVRKPANPKEIAKLHKLFTLANLPVEFRPEHQYLVVLNPRGRVVAGMFYHHVDAKHVHLEKIVVQEHHRRKEISDGLLNEFFNRLTSQGVEIVTVGYLRPQYFYKFGFKIDHRYGNMMKRLESEEQEPAKAELEGII